MAGEDISLSQLRLAEALKLIGRGYAVFPIKPGTKQPATKHGFHDASTDPDQVRAWFDENPSINYGVTRGLLIDVDTKGDKRGDRILSEIENSQDVADWITVNTLAVRTPSGGVHYYLKTPFAPSNSHHFGKGIDVRGGMGYVVGPHSELIEGLCDPEKDTPGIYTVINDAEPMDAPAWVIVNLKRKGEKDPNVNVNIVELDSEDNIARAREFIKYRKPATEKGAHGIGGNDGGDAHTKVTADLVGDLGISEAMCLDLLIEPFLLPGETGESRSWNDRCMPPWDVYGSKGTLEEKVNNSYKYRQRALGNKAVDSASLDEATARAMAQSGVDPDAPPPPSPWDKLAYPYSGIRDIEHREMVIPNVLPAQGVSAIVARRGSGKTVVLVDLSLRIAAGMDWHGWPVEPGRVVFYLAGEDDTGTADMIKGWAIEHGVEDIPNFWFLRGIVNLLDVDSCESFIRWALTKIEPGQKVTIFFDTWQRATSGASQSDDVQMQKAWHHAEFIARMLQAAAVIACHPPKDDRLTIMGSSVMENNTEAIWELTPNDSTKGAKFEVTRIKGGPSGTYIKFEFKVIELGETDQFDRPRTGVVPLKKDGEEFKGPDAMDKRTAFATVMADIELVRAEKKFGHNKNGHYTVKEIARTIAGDPPKKKHRVAGLLEASRGSGEEAEWAKPQVELLKPYLDLLIRPSIETVENKIIQLWQLVPDGHPIVFNGNAVKVGLKNRGLGQVVKVEANTDMMDQAAKEA